MQPTPHQNEQIQSVLGILQRLLGETLLGAYLHGSAVLGGLQPQSDIDLLAVIGSGLSESQRNGLLRDLLRVSERYPAAPGGPRCLEVMVFSEADLASSDYPARAEFVYGEWLRDAFEAGESPVSERDPEYSLVLAQASQEAISLLGRPRDELLAEISLEHVHQAMRDLLPGLLDGLQGDERNVLLALARMWYTAITGKFVPKDVAAQWASTRLSGSDAVTLEQARREYLGEITCDDWNRQYAHAQKLARRISGYVKSAL